MALSPTSSRGGGFSIPSTTNSVPAGTRVILDEFGDLAVIGVGNPGFIGVSESPTVDGSTAKLSSSTGVTTKQRSITVVDGPGNVLGQLEARGYLVTEVHAAPPDGDMDSGSAWLWFDQTNGVGATKLMVKAKSADGTVKTATIVLA